MPFGPAGAPRCIRPFTVAYVEARRLAVYALLAFCGRDKAYLIFASSRRICSLDGRFL